MTVARHDPTADPIDPVHPPGGADATGNAHHPAGGTTDHPGNALGNPGGPGETSGKPGGPGDAPGGAAGDAGLPVLLRAVDPGPAPDGGQPQAAGWCAPLLRGLPVLTTPVSVAGARGPAGRRAARTAVTEAQALGLVKAAARVMFDVLEGRRPEHQLDGLFTEWAASAVRAMRRGGLRWPVRGATLESVHVRLPTALAIEASVVFRSDGRHRALALRLDRDRHRWLATAVRIA